MAARWSRLAGADARPRQSLGSRGAPRLAQGRARGQARRRRPRRLGQEHDPDPVPRPAARRGRLLRARGDGHGAVAAGPAGGAPSSSPARSCCRASPADIVRSMADGPGDARAPRQRGRRQRLGRRVVVLAQLPPGAATSRSCPPTRAAACRCPPTSLVDTIDRVARAASRDETRPVLTGVLLRLAPEGLTMVATDSYRLAVRQTPARGAPAGRRARRSSRRAPWARSPGWPAAAKADDDRGGAHRDPGALPGRRPAPDEPADRGPVPRPPPARARRLRARRGLRPRPSCWAC